MSLRLPLDPSTGVPLYRQLTDALRGAIASGRLAPGEALPNIRELAGELRINYHTVARACQELEDAGLLSRKRGGPFQVAVDAAQDAAEQALRDQLRDVALQACARGLDPKQITSWWTDALAEAAALLPSPTETP